MRERGRREGERREGEEREGRGRRERRNDWKLMQIADAMRKAIVFTGSIGHLLNLITNTPDEGELDIYIDTFSRLPVDGK